MSMSFNMAEFVMTWFLAAKYVIDINNMQRLAANIADLLNDWCAADEVHRAQKT